MISSSELQASYRGEVVHLMKILSQLPVELNRALITIVSEPLLTFPQSGRPLNSAGTSCGGIESLWTL